MKDYQAILDKYKGKKVEAEDSSNLYQCFDWAFVYCDEIEVPREAIRHLYAYEIWTKPNDLTLQYFDYIPNTPNGTAQLGDIVIFSNKVGVAGHVSVCQKADKNSLTSLDENWNGHSYCEYITHSYDSVLGWLRPNMVTMSIDEADSIRLRRDELYREATTLKEKIDFLNIELKTLADDKIDLQNRYDIYRVSHPDVPNITPQPPTVPSSTGTGTSKSFWQIIVDFLTRKIK